MVSRVFFPVPGSATGCVVEIVAVKSSTHYVGTSTAFNFVNAVSTTQVIVTIAAVYRATTWYSHGLCQCHYHHLCYHHRCHHEYHHHPHHQNYPTASTAAPISSFPVTAAKVNHLRPRGYGFVVTSITNERICANPPVQFVTATATRRSLPVSPNKISLPPTFFIELIITRLTNQMYHCRCRLTS